MTTAKQTPALMHIVAALALLWLAMIGQSAAAQGVKTNITAQLQAESPSVAPGESVTLAFVMDPAKGWHGYWENPGDAGLGMVVEWNLPKGIKAGNLRYPVPEILLISGLMNHVYEGRYAILVDLKIDPTLAAGSTLPISVKADWLACTDEICVPERATLSTSLRVAAPNEAINRNTEFDDFRAALPRPLGSFARYQIVDGAFRIAIPFPASAEVATPYFFIRDDGIIKYAAPQRGFRNGNEIIIETKAAGKSGGDISGLFKTAAGEGFDLRAESGEVALAGAPIIAPESQTDTPPTATLWLLLTAFAGAIVGGLLLNLMPCVFPILSLKAIAIAKAGGEEQSVRRDALAYTAGVVSVAVALGLALLALRAGGSAVGWAFQLQDPRIVFLLLIIVTAIGFNLAGLFEIAGFSVGDSLTQQQGSAGSFWTGALAAFVATPCTGPFMAAALGAAIVLPPLAGVLVFAGLGIGLALPFLALAFLPALRNRMPRPGPWLATFRRLMAVPMFLTALALVWLLGQQIGNNPLVIALLFLVLTTMVLWWAGLGQRAGVSRGRIALVMVAALAAIGSAVIPMDGKGSEAVPESSRDGTMANEPYSDARLTELRDSNRPVFIYFTADWCITCKANEAAAINRAETAKAFAAANVAVLVGDWTRPDPVITRVLEQHGRAGVPLYLYYAPGKEAQVLPQILTVETLTDLVAAR